MATAKVRGPKITDLNEIATLAEKYKMVRVYRGTKLHGLMKAKVLMTWSLDKLLKHRLYHDLTPIKSCSKSK